MKIHDVPQGSQEWLQLRAGIPTASCFDRIITPGLKPSGSAQRYMHDLLAEFMLGRPTEGKIYPSMQHGHETELEAVETFEYEMAVTTAPVGFITNDAGTIGASPDRTVGDRELLEVKCPDAPGVHASYLLAAAEGVEDKYMLQLQGQLWISERDAVTIISYHREMPRAIVRVERDDEIIEALDKHVTAFAELLAERQKAIMKEYPGFPKKPKRVFEPVDSEYVSYF